MRHKRAKLPQGKFAYMKNSKLTNGSLSILNSGSGFTRETETPVRSREAESPACADFFFFASFFLFLEKEKRRDELHY
jgi:hypothetical protein